MYVRITDTGKGFNTYEEQVDAGMMLHHIRGEYYDLISIKPTAEEICEMFGYVPVSREEVFPPVAEALVPLITPEQRIAELEAIVEDAIMRGVL